MKKSKRGICMADGGITQETPDQLMARMAAKYGAPTGATQQPQPQSTQQAPQQPKSNPLGIMSMLKGRSAQIDKAVNGYASGGVIKDTADYWENDNAEFEKTNPNFGQRVLRGVNPLTGFGSAMGAMQTAARNGDVLGMAMAGISATPAFGVLRAVPAAGAMKAAVEPSLGKSAAALTGGAVANAAADEYQKGKDQGFANGGIAGHVKFEGKGGPRDDQIPVKVAGQEINVSNKEQALIIPAKTAANAQAMEMIKRIIADSNDGRQPDMGGGENFANGGLLDEEARKMSYQAVTGVQSPAPTPQPASSATANPSDFKPQDPFGPKPEAMGVGKSADGQFATGKTQYDQSGLNKTGMATPDSSGGGFTAKDGTSYNVNPSKQEGIAKITATSKNPLYTNIKPEDAVAGLKNQMIGGSAADVQEGLDRHARANAVWQSVIDKQPQGGIAILGDGGIAADNAEKTARWRQDDLLAQAKNGNRAAGEVARETARGQSQIAAEAIRGGTQLASEQGRNAVTMRGQDMTAQNEANRLSIDAPYRLAQASGQEQQNRSTSAIADLQQRAIAGDAQAAASYRALTGKSEADYKDRYITLPNRKVYNEMGQIVGEESGGLFDAATGKPVDSGAGGQKQQQQAVPPADKREVGKTYQTPKGPLIWRGNGWEAA